MATTEREDMLPAPPVRTMEGTQAVERLLCEEAPAPPRALAAWLSTARSSSTSSPKPQSFSFSTTPEQSPPPEAVESPSMLLIC